MWQLICFKKQVLLIGKKNGCEKNIFGIHLQEEINTSFKEYDEKEKKRLEEEKRKTEEEERKKQEQQQQKNGEKKKRKAKKLSVSNPSTKRDASDCNAASNDSTFVTNTSNTNSSDINPKKSKKKK